MYMSSHVVRRMSPRRRRRGRGRPCATTDATNKATRVVYERARVYTARLELVICICMRAGNLHASQGHPRRAAVLCVALGVRVYRIVPPFGFPCRPLEYVYVPGY
jgi:hypothetical protein